MGYLLLFLLVLFADQLTKAIAFAVMGSESSLHTWIPNFLGIRTTVNTGVSFGWFGDEPWAMPVFIAITAVALVVFFIFFLKAAKRKHFLRVALVLIMVGAAGNLIDLCVMAGVRDLIWMNFGFVDFSNNLADIAIFIGAIMFILALFFVDDDAVFRPNKKKEEQELEEAATDLTERAAKAEKSEEDVGPLSDG